MSKKQFIVTLNYYVDAENEDDAIEKARNGYGEAAEFMDYAEFVKETSEPGDIIKVISFDGKLTVEEAKREVKFATGFLVADDSEHTIEYNEENNITTIYNVKLGRKANENS